MMRRWTILLISVAIAAMGIAGCDTEAAEPDEGESAEIAPSPVETLVLAPTDFVDTFEVLGTSDPVDAVQISSDVPGKILEARADRGDTVQRGQVLFRIDTETDQAGQEVLQTQVEAAERELARLERLREEGLSTEQQVDNARTELAQAEKNLRQSQISISRSTVRSPLAGHMAIRYADPGEFANAGAPLAEIIDYSTILVSAQVPESQIRHVHVDESSTLPVEFPALGERREATVERVALRPSPATRTYAVELHVDNEDLQIRPGMRARVHFERQRYDEAVLIPRDAILEGYDGREAMVVEGDQAVGRAMTRRLVTGPGTRDRVVVEQGLEVGERLILRGHRGLIGDARVEVIEEVRQGEQETP